MLYRCLRIKLKIEQNSQWDLLLELSDEALHARLTNIQIIRGVPVTAIDNTIQCVISGSHFHITEKEMLNGLADQDGVYVQRINIH